MSLLVRFARDFTRIATPNVGFTLAIAGSLAGVELLGRQSATDLHDLMAVLVLVMLCAVVAMRQKRSPLPWLAAMGQRIGWLAERFHKNTFEIGLDLRGSPPVKRGAPPIVLVLALVFAVWAGVATLVAAECPRGLRALALHGSYLVYLMFLTVTWIGTILLTLLAAFLPAAMIHDAFIGGHTQPGPRSRRPEYTALLAYFVLLMMLGTLLPVGVSLCLCSCFLIAYLVVCRLPARASVRFLWRPAGTVRVRSLTWSDWVTWEFVLITLGVFALVLTTCGDRLWGDRHLSETMPVTALLGMGLAWLAPGALGALLLQMTLGRLRDPARSARPTALLADVEPSQRHRVRAAFAERGWQVRFGAGPARPNEVAIGFSGEPVLSSSGDIMWPIMASAADLNDPGFWQRIGRRNEIQLRRKLLSALERLFKLAAGRPMGNGHGYWVAPHFWFVPGLMRDNQREVDEEAEFGEQALLSGTVGPPYHRFVPRPVRHHLWRMLRALQIDLIFVEDGVGFRRLRRVLRVLFEVFDVHAGRRPASEIDFRGLPGIRVLIHEYQFDDPFKSEIYPEPKYDYLGRARILHVFRDRGGHEEFVEPPFDTSRSPAPVGAI